MKSFYFYFIGMTVLGLQACQLGDGYQDIRNYYFPLKTLESGLVYEYEPLGISPNGTAYWYYRSLIDGDEVNLTGTYYEQELIPQQLSNERMTGAGMILQDLFLYENDSSNAEVQIQIPVQVIEDDVFPFRVKENGGVYLYHIRWQPPQDSGATIDVIKNRRYLGDTTITFQDQQYAALIFELKELIAYDKEGVLEQEYNGREIYAKGLGLYYYSKRISEDLHLRYQLKDRYPMERLEEKFRLQYQE
ncbi:MAG TPA: hypothetical protein VJ953_03150 [Saprospiraceae bacterium]|nr:hypothetical protein [Saprospiraceae bacterium]